MAGASRGLLESIVRATNYPDSVTHDAVLAEVNWERIDNSDATTALSQFELIMDEMQRAERVVFGRVGLRPPPTV